MCSFGFRPLSSGCQAERLCPPDDRWAAVVYHRPLLASIHEHVLPKSHIGRGNAGWSQSVERIRIHPSHTSDLPKLSRIRVWDKDRNTKRASNADSSWERESEGREIELYLISVRFHTVCPWAPFIRIVWRGEVRD